ncbi:MAG: hypothetical protein HWN66_13530 [Candidatus Helarchaeota archaeon]|nr:hypothetical protein [Candidatus Helarchaeota archaeon]
MNLKQKRGLVAGIPLISIGIFGLLFYHFIIYDLISIYLSLFCTIGGLVILGLGLIEKLPFKYTNPRLLIISIIGFFLIGTAFFIFYLVWPHFSFDLLVALTWWSVTGTYLWILFAQKELDDNRQNNQSTQVS